MNLQIIQSNCALIKKKEEDKIDEKNNIGSILIKVDESVRKICDRIKVFKEIRMTHKPLYALFDSQQVVEYEILDELEHFYKDLKA